MPGYASITRKGSRAVKAQADVPLICQADDQSAPNEAIVFGRQPDVSEPYPSEDAKAI